MSDRFCGWAVSIGLCRLGCAAGLDWLADFKLEAKREDRENISEQTINERDESREKTKQELSATKPN